jgi:hypothetical protein
MKINKVTKLSMPPEPLETVEQQIFINLVNAHKRRYPELWLLYAIPNGGNRSVTEALRLKREGVKCGIPDICLPVARGGYHAWYGELKRKRSGHLSDDQQEVIEALRIQGHWAGWHRGADEMFADLIWYLSLPATKPDTGLLDAIRPERNRRPIIHRSEVSAK